MKSSFTINRTINAPADRVFDVLTDHRNYASITPMRVSTLEKEGEPDPNGVGAVRKLGLAGPPIVEEVVGYEKPTFFSYKVLSGLPVKEQLGEVRLRDVGGRTELSYTVSFTSKLPRTEPVLGVVQRQAIGALVRGIAKSVE
jgi:polyketide cyclase/dehydrase/lipid transport protein